MTRAASARVLSLLLAGLLGAGSAMAHHAVAHDMLVTSAPRVSVQSHASDTAQVHVSLRNRSRYDHALIGAESSLAEEAWIIAGTPTPAGEPERADPLKGLTVPARGTLRLAPGGPHILLIGVTAQLRPGDVVPVTLRFQDQSVLKLTAEVSGP